jgi:hypothetical protein
MKKTNKKADYDIAGIDINDLLNEETSSDDEEAVAISKYKNQR